MKKLMLLVVVCLLFVVADCSVAGQFSWQQPEARVLPSGDIAWQPREFVFEVGDSVRYIDFESGNDANDGRNKQTPWKHHPWDPAATERAEEEVAAVTDGADEDEIGAVTVDEGGESPWAAMSFDQDLLIDHKAETEKEEEEVEVNLYKKVQGMKVSEKTTRFAPCADASSIFATASWMVCRLSRKTGAVCTMAKCVMVNSPEVSLVTIGYQRQPAFRRVLRTDPGFRTGEGFPRFRARLHLFRCRSIRTTFDAAHRTIPVRSADIRWPSSAVPGH